MVGWRKSRNGRSTVALLVLIGFAVGIAAETRSSFEGTIRRAEYDPKTKKVLRVYVATADGSEVLVVNQGPGRELRRHVGAKVKVSGVAKKAKSVDGRFERVIYVDDYAVIEPAPGKPPGS